MAFSIVSSVAAFIVMVPVSVQVGTSNRLRLEVAQEMPTNGRADYNNPCSYSRASYDSSGGRFDLPAQQTICVEEVSFVSPKGIVTLVIRDNLMC